MANATSSNAMLIWAPTPDWSRRRTAATIGERGIQATADIPGRQHMVDRAGMVRGSGDQRESGRRVDGVVHAGRAIVAAEQLEVDHVGPFRRRALSNDNQDKPEALVTTTPSPSTISRWTSSCPSGERRSMVAERFPLFRPVQ